jgi:riboflavin-specific deaminase-like protein
VSPATTRHHDATKESPLSDTINERVAWSLAQAVTPGLAGMASPARVHHHRNPDVWLQVDPSGQWAASAEVSGAARDLFDLFLPIQISSHLVIGQFGQSLDGRIATENGHSHYVTGPADIRRLHRLRALVDAVIVGAGTVAADNPRLTVREVEGHNPVRVVLDPNGRLTRDRALFTDGAARTVVIRRAPDGETSIEGDVWKLADAGVDPKNGQGERRGFEPSLILETLRDQGLRRVLVEGGGVTVSRFLQAGSLTRLHVTVAPLLIGSGRHSLTLPPIASLGQALRPPCHLFRLGDDVLFDLDLSRPS